MAKFTSLLVLFILSCYLCHSSDARLDLLTISRMEEFRVERRAFTNCLRKCKETLKFVKELSPEIPVQERIDTHDTWTMTPSKESKYLKSNSSKSDRLVCINLCFAILSPDQTAPKPTLDPAASPRPHGHGHQGPATPGHFCYCAWKTVCHPFFRKCFCTNYKCWKE